MLVCMTLSTVKEMIFDATAFGGLAFFVASIVFAAFFDSRLALQLFAGLALSYLVCFSIRWVYFRPRPDGSVIEHWYDRVTQSAFPSLHATRVTALGVIAGVFFDDVWMWVFFSVMVFVTAWTRLLLKRHYVSDVIGGVIGGVLIAALVVIVW